MQEESALYVLLGKLQLKVNKLNSKMRSHWSINSLLHLIIQLEAEESKTKKRMEGIGVSLS